MRVGDGSGDDITGVAPFDGLNRPGGDDQAVAFQREMYAASLRSSNRAPPVSQNALQFSNSQTSDADPTRPPVAWKKRYAQATTRDTRPVETPAASEAERLPSVLAIPDTVTVGGYYRSVSGFSLNEEGNAQSDWTGDRAFDAVDYPARPGLGVITSGFSTNAEGKVTFSQQAGVFTSQIGPNGGYLLRPATPDEIGRINGTNRVDARQARHDLLVAGGVSIGLAAVGGAGELANPLLRRALTGSRLVPAGKVPPAAAEVPLGPTAPPKLEGKLGFPPSPAKEAPPAAPPAQLKPSASEPDTVTGTARRGTGPDPADYHQTTDLWTKNPGGPRTIAEAREIAEEHGADIANDIHFVVLPDEVYAERIGNSYAAYGRFTVQGDQLVRWKAASRTGSGIVDSTGKITVWVRQSVLESDQQITAVFGHETYEIEALRDIFRENGGAIPASKYNNLVRPGVAGNLHQEAVAHGDQLVREMVGKGAD